MLFYNFSCNNSQDNSYIENIDFTRMNNPVNITIKNQVEKNPGKFHIIKINNIIKNICLFFISY